ncbi:MAG TPA: hypothetical protein VGM47_10120 [Gammaproteobacteria bacterium]
MDTLKLNGLVLAALAAALFAAAPLAADQPGNSTGKCFGVNACRGKSSCKSPGHSCKSQNACKGQGFVTVSKDTCEQIGGRFEADKP